MAGNGDKIPDAIHVKFETEFLKRWTAWRKKHGLTQQFAVRSAMEKFMSTYKVGG